MSCMFLGQKYQNKVMYASDYRCLSDDPVLGTRELLVIFYQ